MVKKRRQSDPNVDDSDSTSDENFRASTEKSGDSPPKCGHAKKAVDGTKLRRIYKKLTIEIEKCAECKKLTVNGDEAEKNEDDYELDLSLWMCLKCGSHLCGRTVNKHALKHYEVNQFNLYLYLYLYMNDRSLFCKMEFVLNLKCHCLQTPRSDSHALALNTTT